MKILVVNPNTSASMTDAIAATARQHAAPGTEVIPLRAAYGSEGIDCNVDSLISAVAVMDLLTTYRGEFDAVVMAGFGEHGREGVQELLRVPVVDICEAAAHVAQLLGRTYAVVTTLARSVSSIEDRLLLAGQRARCASVRSTGMTTAETDAHPEAAYTAVVEQARLAVEVDRAEVVCLGCAGMAGLAEAVTAAVRVPVVDGVAAGMRLAQALVGLGLGTSKVLTYATPEPRPLVGWPLSAHLDLPERPR